MRALLFILCSLLFLLSNIDGKRHHWVSTSTTTSTNTQPDSEDKHLNPRNESSQESSPVKDDSLASELADAVGQVGSEEPLVVSGVVSNWGVSKPSLKLAAPQMSDSSEQNEDLELTDKKPMPKSSPSPAPLSKVHLDSPSRSRGITLDSSEEDIQSNKNVSKTAGEREKLLDSIQVVTTSKPPKPKGRNIEVRDELVDPYKNLRQYTFSKQNDDEDVEERRQPVAHPLPHTNAYILRLRREAPKPDATIKEVKEAPGGVAFTVNTEPDSPRKAKPVLSSSSRSSSISSRSNSPRIEAGMEIRKRRALESPQLLHSVGAKSSNRSMLADLLGIGLKAPMLAIDPKEEDNGHVPKKFVKTELSLPPRPKVQVQSSSSSSDSEEKSHQNDSSNEDNSLEQILIIAESEEKESKSQHFIKNMHKNSIKTGPIFIQNSELHFESGGMAKPHKPHPFDPRPFGMKGRSDLFLRGGPPPMPFGGHPPPFSPNRGPQFGGPPSHPAGFGREMDKDGHFGREMPPPPPPAFRKEIERGEEGLWMLGRGLTLTLHLNATSLGILSMLVVIVLLFKLYKMVHKKQSKHFFAHCNQEKEEKSNKQAPSISILDEIKI